MVFCVFFFFKQKTAYEMRISDWSSDVCSSDLFEAAFYARDLPSLHGDVVARIAGPIARPVAEVHACRPRADRQPLFERAPPLGPIVEQRFVAIRSEEHTSEHPSLMSIPLSVFCI